MITLTFNLVGFFYSFVLFDAKSWCVWRFLFYSVHISCLNYDVYWQWQRQQPNIYTIPLDGAEIIWESVFIYFRSIQITQEKKPVIPGIHITIVIKLINEFNTYLISDYKTKAQF